MVLFLQLIGWKQKEVGGSWAKVSQRDQLRNSTLIQQGLYLDDFIFLFTMILMYNPFLVYCRELAPGTVSFTGDRAQGDDSKHDLHYIFKLKTYGKCSKIWYKMTFGYQGLNLRNTCQNIKQTGKTQIRLLLKKQSALGLRCLFCTQLVFEFFEHLLYSFVFTVADPGFLEKGVHMYEGVGVRFADFLLFFLNII